jgi:hypothetical protein
MYSDGSMPLFCPTYSMAESSAGFFFHAASSTAAFSCAVIVAQRAFA